jgi:hypothetical protein
MTVSVIDVTRMVAESSKASQGLLGLRLAADIRFIVGLADYLVLARPGGGRWISGS